MGSKRTTKTNQNSSTEQMAAIHQEIGSLKRDVSGYARDIEDCGRDIRDIRKELKDALGKRRGWIAFALFILGFLGYTSWNGIRKVQEELLNEAETRLQKQVAALYEEKNVDKMVAELVQQRAEALIKEATKEQVQPIVAQLKEDQTESSQVIAQMRAAQDNYAQIVELSDLIIKAQNADKKSWMKLMTLAEREQTTERGKFARDAAKRIYDQFFTNEFYQSGFIYSPKVSNEAVVAALTHRWADKRKTAVYSIKHRLMYDQIPALIAMLPAEQNLDVLAEMFHTLNDLLSTNVQFGTSDIQKRFSDAWEAKRTLLNQAKTGTSRNERGDANSIRVPQ
jgi:hypothetical protein